VDAAAGAESSRRIATQAGNSVTCRAESGAPTESAANHERAVGHRNVGCGQRTRRSAAVAAGTASTTRDGPASAAAAVGVTTAATAAAEHRQGAVIHGYRAAGHVRVQRHFA